MTYLVKAARERGAQALEPTPEGEDAYVQEVRSLARMGQRFYTECTPGYYNSEGAPGNRKGFFSDMYGAGPLRLKSKNCRNGPAFSSKDWSPMRPKSQR